MYILMLYDNNGSEKEFKEMFYYDDISDISDMLSTLDYLINISFIYENEVVNSDILFLEKVENFQCDEYYKQPAGVISTRDVYMRIYKTDFVNADDKAVCEKIIE